jgi:hypothetical protein
MTDLNDATAVRCPACDREAGEECNLIFEFDPKGIIRNKFAYFRLIHIARWAAAGKLAEVEWAIEGQS